MLLRRTNLVALVSLLASATIATSANAQKKYDPGASDTEIKIGNIMPYSGPASAYGPSARRRPPISTRSCRGRINGRKINFISYDDAFSPPKAVEQAQAGRERRGAVDLPALGNAIELGDAEIHERQEGAAALRGDRCHE
jgi:hypothetical protein